MNPVVVYLHGIGGADSRDKWLKDLNHELDRAGYERLQDSDLIDFDYARFLEGRVGDDQWEPPVTLYKSPGGQEQAERAYFDNLRRFEERITDKRHSRSWLSRIDGSIADFASGRTSQVANYQKRREVRAAVWSHILARVPEHGRVVLVGHSLGSVIAADLACRLPGGIELAALITVASPLGGVPSLRKHSHLLATTGDFPYSRVRMWVNIYSPRDPVTVGRGIAKYYPAALDVPINTGTWREPLPVHNHGIAMHAGHPAVATAVGWALFGDPAPRPDRQLPVQRFDPLWDPHLMAFAYADELLGKIPYKSAGRRHALRLAIDDRARKSEQQARTLNTELDSIVEGASGAERELAESVLDRTRTYPSSELLQGRAGAVLERRFSSRELVPYAVFLLNGYPLPPFDIEGKPSPERTQALTALLRRVHRRSRTNPTSEPLADAADKALNAVCDALDVKRSGVARWATGGACGGLHVLGTLQSIGLAGPTGASGAVASSVGRTAMGPGGMVADLAMTLAIFGADGLGDDRRRSEAPREAPSDAASQRRVRAMAALSQTLSALDPDRLRYSLVTFLAIVRVQEGNTLPSNRQDLGQAVAEALSSVDADLLVASGVSKESEHAVALRERAKILRRAADWLHEDHWRLGS